MLDRDEDILKAAEDWQRAGRGVALATVVETWGSAPRPAGSSLVINDEGTFLGSVSGGCVEGAVVTEAMDVIESGIWFAKVARKEYSIGLNLTGAGIDDPDQTFYENYGFGIRAAYNWRDEFLSATFDGTGTPNPNYTEAYGQIDISASYDITDAFTVQAEVINLTDETQRVHGRHENQLLWATQTGPRYMIGARYKFGQ